LSTPIKFSHLSLCLGALFFLPTLLTAQESGAAVLVRWTLVDSIVLVLLALTSYLVACFAHGPIVSHGILFNNLYFLIVIANHGGHIALRSLEGGFCEHVLEFPHVEAPTTP